MNGSYDKIPILCGNQIPQQTGVPVRLCAGNTQFTACVCRVLEHLQSLVRQRGGGGRRDILYGDHQFSHFAGSERSVPQKRNVFAGQNQAGYHRQRTAQAGQFQTENAVGGHGRRGVQCGVQLPAYGDNRLPVCAGSAAVKPYKYAALRCQRHNRLHRSVGNQLYCSELVVHAVQRMGADYHQERHGQYFSRCIYSHVVHAGLAEKRDSIHTV